MYHIKQRRTGFYYAGDLYGVPVFTGEVKDALNYHTPAGELRKALLGLNEGRPGWCDIAFTGSLTPPQPRKVAL